MQAKNFVKVPLKGLMGLRSLHYFLQFQTLSRLTSALPFLGHQVRPVRREDFELLFRELKSLIDQDVDHMLQGVYPVHVLKPESFLQHSLRVPRLFVDGIRLSWRRKNKAVHRFSIEAQIESQDLPEYYLRNYHFQTDGYLSESSAELYEHQVELLFSGAADAMRRLFLPALKKELDARDKLSESLNILETACGTGRGSRFVKLAFPMAKVTATDLSAPYLRVAQRKLRDLPDTAFLKADAARLPFANDSFDVVFNIYLFHELPRSERDKVLQEAWRVLRPGGYFAAVDSLQLGDRPEFDGHLKQFPRDYHEPFYMDYIKNPLEERLRHFNFDIAAIGTGFLSKYWVAKKPTT